MRSSVTYLSRYESREICCKGDFIKPGFDREFLSFFKGQAIRITALVQEYFGFTELTNIEDVTVLSSGIELPLPQFIETGQLPEKQWEGVPVEVRNVTVTNQDLGYGVFYSW